MTDGPTLKDILFHMLILIPIEFGLLHATPLGGMITGLFEGMFQSMGVEFAAHAHGAASAIAPPPGLSEAAPLSAAPASPEHFHSSGEAFGHRHGLGHAHGAGKQLNPFAGLYPVNPYPDGLVPVLP